MLSGCLINEVTFVAVMLVCNPLQVTCVIVIDTQFLLIDGPRSLMAFSYLHTWKNCIFTSYLQTADDGRLDV